MEVEANNENYKQHEGRGGYKKNYRGKGKGHYHKVQLKINKEQKYLQSESIPELRK